MSPDLGSARLTTALALAFGLCLVAPSLVRADGGGGGSNSPNAPTCGKGEYWSDRTRNCEKLRAGVLTDGELARYAVLLARSKRYDEAMDAFNLMHEPLVRLMPDRDSTEIALQARMMFSAVHGIISLGLEERMVAVPPEQLRRQLAQFVDTYLIGLGLMPPS